MDDSTAGCTYQQTVPLADVTCTEATWVIDGEEHTGTLRARLDEFGPLFLYRMDGWTVGAYVYRDRAYTPGATMKIDESLVALVNLPPVSGLAVLVMPVAVPMLRKRPWWVYERQLSP